MPSRSSLRPCHPSPNPGSHWWSHPCPHPASSLQPILYLTHEPTPVPGRAAGHFTRMGWCPCGLLCRFLSALCVTCPRSVLVARLSFILTEQRFIVDAPWLVCPSSVDGTVGLGRDGQCHCELGVDVFSFPLLGSRERNCGPRSNAVSAPWGPAGPRNGSSASMQLPPLRAHCTSSPLSPAHIPARAVANGAGRGVCSHTVFSRAVLS